MSRRDTLTADSSSSTGGIAYEAANPMYSRLPSDAVTTLLRSNEALMGIATQLEHRRGMREKDAQLVQLVRATIEGNMRLAQALDDKIGASTEELARAVGELQRAQDLHGSAPRPTISSVPGDLLAVVFTVDPLCPDVVGKPLEKVRKALPDWVRAYVKKHDLDVVGGPWLDDSATLTQPHVNMTIRQHDKPVKELFKFWAMRKGYVYSSPVISYDNWTSYADRNDEVCRQLYAGEISEEEAAPLITGNVRPTRRAVFQGDPNRKPKGKPRKVSFTKSTPSAANTSTSTVAFDSEDDDLLPASMTPSKPPAVRRPLVYDSDDDDDLL